MVVEDVRIPAILISARVRRREGRKERIDVGWPSERDAGLIEDLKRRVDCLDVVIGPNGAVRIRRPEAGLVPGHTREVGKGIGKLGRRRGKSAAESSRRKPQRISNLGSGRRRRLGRDKSFEERHSVALPRDYLGQRAYINVREVRANRLTRTDTLGRGLAYGSDCKGE